MTRIIVGEGSCGIAAGAEDVREALQAVLPANATLGITGCVGACFLEPIVDVYDESGKLWRCVHVAPENAPAIAQAAASGDFSGLADLLIKPEDAEFLSRQTRVALRHCGVIDPDSIDSYIAAGGYQALEKALRQMTPESVIETMKTSGLGGRGGAGFPTWFKWQAARDSKGEEKYMICNADEGDPGAFM
ncbi:MAG: NADH-quinone oxidoreductase subunit F, partial [Oscillospiraceae bacterium]|nr:NADH-quinone oxidoreductase subunit F [Oscillospiraceae bacterium]